MYSSATCARIPRPWSAGPAARWGGGQQRLGVTRISSDGGSVAFYSTAGNLDNGIPPLDPAHRDAVVYVRDLSGLTTQLVSRATGPDGVAATSHAGLGSISGDGHRVAFQTDAPSADRPDKQQSDVW